MDFVQEDRAPLGSDSSKADKSYVCREYDVLMFSFKVAFLPCLDYKCLKLLYLYVKITLYYVKKTNMMYESNCIQNQAAANHKRLKQSNATSWSSHQLDLEYLQVRDSIVKSEYYKTLQRQSKIRLNGWISKLDGIITNSVWKKNRNHYAKLINLMCQCEVLISPFTALPPHSDIPTLTKFQINAIIDQVELTVKNNTLKAQNWIKEQLRQENYEKETPKEYWSRVRQIKSKYQSSNLEQSSIKQANSVDFPSKHSQTRVKRLNQSINYSQQSIKSLPLRVINLSQKQNIKPDAITFTKNVNTPDHKTCKKKLFRDQSSSKNNQNSRIQLKVRPSQNIIPASFTKSKRIGTNYTGISQSSEPPLNFRDQHQSIQIADDTLQTQAFYSQSCESYTQKDTSQMNQSHLTQCNFSDEFSERCRNKQEVLIKNYFSWKKPSKAVTTNKPLMQIQMEQIQPLDLNSERIQPSNSVTIESILSNETESKVTGDSKYVELSSSYQKHYWESDSISCDINYHEEGETIEIKQCEQQELGEQRTIHLSKPLDDLKTN